MFNKTLLAWLDQSWYQKPICTQVSWEKSDTENKERFFNSI
jgi:hypothetical protein